MGRCGGVEGSVECDEKGKRLDVRCCYEGERRVNVSLNVAKGKKYQSNAVAIKLKLKLR